MSKMVYPPAKIRWENKVGVKQGGANYELSGVSDNP